MDYHNPRFRSSSVMRLAPLFCKLAFEYNFQNSNPNTEVLQRLEEILNLSIEGKLDVSKISLDTTYDQLNNSFGKVIDDEEYASNERSIQEILDSGMCLDDIFDEVGDFYDGFSKVKV